MEITGIECLQSGVVHLARTCAKCGQRLDGFEIFCPQCGRKLEPIPTNVTEGSVLAVLNESRGSLVRA